MGASVGRSDLGKDPAGPKPCFGESFLAGLAHIRNELAEARIDPPSSALGKAKRTSRFTRDLQDVRRELASSHLAMNPTLPPWGKPYWPPSVLRLKDAPGHSDAQVTCDSEGLNEKA